MLRMVYNASLFLLVLISLPQWIWEAMRHRKHRHSFLAKLGLRLPRCCFAKAGPRLWVHSISVGETKAVLPLMEQLRQKYPGASVVVSNVTETGFEEALKAKADHTFYLPLDFSWNIRQLMRRIKPDLLILVEGDFWLNLITLAPRVVLVNGKISEKSLSRFKKVPFFTQPLLGKIELLCVQSDRFKNRFIALGVDPSRIVVTGNLKFDQTFLAIDKPQWQNNLGILPTDQVLTLGSTHDPEEELLLQALSPLFHKFPRLKILLIPRHPERFSDVAALLEKKGLHYSRYSDPLKDNSKRIVLVDAMGVLSACYQLSEIAIVGGSFRGHLRGHNIFEPAALGVPVLFGPFMDSQKDLVELVHSAGAGKQVTLEEICQVVDHLLTTPSSSMRQAGLNLARRVQGATGRTLQALEPFILEKV